MKKRCLKEIACTKRYQSSWLAKDSSMKHETLSPASAVVKTSISFAFKVQKCSSRASSRNSQIAAKIWDEPKKLMTLISRTCEIDFLSFSPIFPFHASQLIFNDSKIELNWKKIKLNQLIGITRVGPRLYSVSLLIS